MKDECLPDPGETTPADRGRVAYRYPVVLAGQPALVTGANSGIGRAVALGLAASGADVVVNYVVNKAAAEEVAHTIEAAGRRAVAIQADVSKEEEVASMFARAIDHFGTLHIAVSNAGLQRDASLHDMTLDQWNEVIGVNLTGQFLCAREAVREFRKRGLCRGWQARFHEFRPPGDTLGRPRQLRRFKRRDHAVDEEHSAGSGTIRNQGQWGGSWRDTHRNQQVGVGGAGCLSRSDDPHSL